MLGAVGTVIWKPAYVGKGSNVSINLVSISMATMINVPLRGRCYGHYIQPNLLTRLVYFKVTHIICRWSSFWFVNLRYWVIFHGFLIEWKDVPKDDGDFRSLEPEIHLDGAIDILQRYCRPLNLDLSNIKRLLGGKREDDECDKNKRRESTFLKRSPLLLG